MLPKDWQRSTLGECIEILTGYAFSSQNYATANTSAVRLLRGDNVMQGALRWDDAKYWALPYDKPLERYEMQVGDIVIAMDRPITNAGLKCSSVQETDLPCLLVQRVARMRAKANFDQDYLAQVLQTHSFIQHLKGQKTETAVPHISPNDLRDFAIVFPEKTEQRRIAKVLSTWDQAIATTQRLLANTITQQSLLLEALTSGTRRLINTGSPWKTFSLCDLGSPYSGLSGKSGQDFGTGAKFIPYTNVFKNSRIDINDLSLVQVGANEQQSRVQYGDILFTTSSETPHEVGMTSVLLDEVDELFLNSFCFGYRMKSFDILLPTYAGYAFRSSEIRSAMTKLAQGSTRFNISKANVMRLKVKVPSTLEQKMIVDVLDTAQSMVENVADQLKALRQQKTSLMAQLLAGKRRVQRLESASEVMV